MTTQRIRFTVELIMIKKIDFIHCIYMTLMTIYSFNQLSLFSTQKYVVDRISMLSLLIDKQTNETTMKNSQFT